MPKRPVPFSPPWCLLADRLVVAASLETLKAELARGLRASLAEVDEVASAVGQQTAPRGDRLSGHVDTLRTVYTMIQAFGPGVAGALAQQGIKLELPPLPSLEILQPHIRPMVQFVRRPRSKESFSNGTRRFRSAATR